MSGFKALIDRLEAQEILTPQDRARLRDLKARQARLERHLSDASIEIAQERIDCERRRAKLAEEMREAAKQELAARALCDLPLWGGK